MGAITIRTSEERLIVRLLSVEDYPCPSEALTAAEFGWTRLPFPTTAVDPEVVEAWNLTPDYIQMRLVIEFIERVGENRLFSVREFYDDPAETFVLVDDAFMLRDYWDFRQPQRTG